MFEQHIAARGLGHEDATHIRGVLERARAAGSIEGDDLHAVQEHLPELATAAARIAQCTRRELHSLPGSDVWSAMARAIDDGAPRQHDFGHPGSRDPMARDLTCQHCGKTFTRAFIAQRGLTSVPCD
jgi:tape measure domain-containing protein